MATTYNHMAPDEVRRLSGAKLQRMINTWERLAQIMDDGPREQAHNDLCVHHGEVFVENLKAFMARYLELATRPLCLNGRRVS